MKFADNFNPKATERINIYKQSLSNKKTFISEYIKRRKPMFNQVARRIHNESSLCESLNSIFLI